METSRRSACDRCRAQKLRCVRPSNPGNAIHWENESLRTCARCLKSKTHCFNTHPRPRDAIRAKGLPPVSASSSIPSSKKIQSRSLISENTSRYQYGIGVALESSMNNDGKIKDSFSSSTDSTSMYQPITSQEQREESRLKRTLQEPVYNHLGANTADQVLPEAQNSSEQARNKSGGNNNTRNSLSIDGLNTPTLIADKSPASKLHECLSIDTFDFGMIMTPEFNAHPDNTADPLHDLFTPGQGTKTVPSDNHTAGSALSSSEKPDSKEDCLLRLSDLSSTLLNDSSRTNSRKLSDVLSSSPRCNSMLPHPSDETQTFMHSRNTIGQVLESSQTFLDILQYFNLNQPSSADSECSYSEYWEDGDFFATTMANSHSNTPNATILALSDNTHLSLSDTTHLSTAERSNAQEKSSCPSVAVDMPTTLTILTCYTCLLQTYDTIFSQLYNALSSSAEITPRSIPAIIPGLHIGGFDLDKHRDLQMEVLIQLSWRMLERIEKILGINVISQQPQDDQNSSTPPRGRGILDTATASALLDVMFKQKDLDCWRGVNGRTALVRQTMENIREILEGGGS